MASEDDEPCRRSCADCMHLRWYGVSVCVCTGRMTRPGHDSTECGAFRWRWDGDAKDD